MEMNQLDVVHGSSVSSDSLLLYLSQIVLSRTDETIEKKQRHIDELKARLTDKKLQLKTIKDRITKISVENRRLKALYQLLQLIDRLKQEGILIGRNKEKISRLLYRIEEKDTNTLLALISKLKIHLPAVQNNRVTIS